MGQVAEIEAVLQEARDTIDSSDPRMAAAAKAILDHAESLYRIWQEAEDDLRLTRTERDRLRKYLTEARTIIETHNPWLHAEIMADPMWQGG